jgi:hypothetical protein
MVEPYGFDSNSCKTRSENFAPLLVILARCVLAAQVSCPASRSESPEAAQQILGNVSRALEKEAQGMLLSANGVRVISGQEEAVAGWISANYLLQTIYPVSLGYPSIIVDERTVTCRYSFTRDFQC